MAITSWADQWTGSSVSALICGRFRAIFESAFATSVFWIDVLKLDLAPGAAPRKLAVSAALAGEVSGAFVPAEPFTYLNHHAA